MSALKFEIDEVNTRQVYWRKSDVDMPLCIYGIKDGSVVKVSITSGVMDTRHEKMDDVHADQCPPKKGPGIIIIDEMAYMDDSAKIRPPKSFYPSDDGNYDELWDKLSDVIQRKIASEEESHFQTDVLSLSSGEDPDNFEEVD